MGGNGGGRRKEQPLTRAMSVIILGLLDNDTHSPSLWSEVPCDIHNLLLVCSFIHSLSVNGNVWVGNGI